MEYKSRMSLNTSIKNAKIFDDSSIDEDYYLDNLIKKEDIKKEKEEENDTSLNYYIDTLPNNDLKSILKKENTFEDTKIKIEFEAEGNDPVDNNSISQKVAQLGLVTPVKNEETTRNTLKSVKRSLTKARSSPYTKEKCEPSISTTPKKREYSGNIRYDKSAKMSKSSETETDPVVLARRQKQIDFGKNTIGYDNYINTVPKHARKSDDPMTPNKYRVYSRRGFDGLIKQWRLKLHKYD